MLEIGMLSKMKVVLANKVQYYLKLQNNEVLLNDFIEKEFKMHYTGRIFCVSCGKQTKKSFGQGFCYPCFIKSPDNAECIVKPELCMAHLGIGRDIEWEKKNHLQPHSVYLALSNDVKVGVTRNTQIPTRWIDQGASQAIVIAEFPYRQLAGITEVALKKYFPDKTNWQRMLKNEIASGADLLQRKNDAILALPTELQTYASPNNEITVIHYPVTEYPFKVTSLNFEKVPEINAKLKGIKGQYLIFENGLVFNVRNNSGYEIEFSA